ncbi:D-glycero-alpha-D-manno-heptose-1,7-bisphosphate 7-phosphatase [Fictibacillus terranigra]|uniref:D,D-heptose 1,7-bisphosphate phosphatase n=1 Tax=Fictibacillus terranigra TaxID=3058424 RepID=A0ABT8E5J8_9BACL|nr:HAD family hydrolase [Fictibacillus sp. CENA-BCM004]MDN4073181.1 HAD family hydrolase [Fictibacillus sp. CENA-BCM004]
MTKAVFIDRDGVINEVMTSRVKHVNHPSSFYFLDGALEGLRELTEMGFSLFVVTNQGGVGLGFLQEKMLKKIHEKMVLEAEKAGGVINDIAYCCHKPHEGCSCRKPSPGMILDLAERYNIDLTNSFMIGDRETDVEAGRKAGVTTVKIGGEQGEADFLAADLREAAGHIRAYEKIKGRSD